MDQSLRKKTLALYKMNEIVSVVSHQLKTPLTAVKGYLEVLLTDDLGNLNKDQKDYAQAALENTKRVIVLVKDLLDVSCVEQDRMEFRLQPTNFEELVKQTIDEFSFLAKAKNCKLSLKILGSTPILNIDSIKIKQVLANLISNAISYSKRKGNVEITLSKNVENVIFCCKDNGIGIAEKDKISIFTKFHRSEEAITHTTEGSGLGLFITKAIVEKSGGKIWFQSKKSEGSMFCFSLPILKVS